MVVVVLVVVVVPVSPVVDLSVVVDEPGAARACRSRCREPLPEPSVVVVLEPPPSVLCANVIAGAMRRKRARSMKLSLKDRTHVVLPENEV